MIDYSKIPSPCFVLDEGKLEENLSILNHVQTSAGVDIILAFKGFAMWSVFPQIKRYLKGATVSSLNEARLCHDEMHTKAHTYMVAYPEHQFDEVVDLSSHITFNSIQQLEKLQSKVPNEVSIGIRVNPEWSDVTTGLYNPSDSKSRLGLTRAVLGDNLPARVEGLHFHVLCESSAEASKTVLEHFENKFGQFLHRLKWVNMGGGHLITKTDYDVELLISKLKSFKEKYDVQIILEPGAAIAWQAGDLVTSVLDVVTNGGVKTIIIDASFTCHMPDCLEMPYRPEIANGHLDPENGRYQYRIGGLSCLAGDYLELYGFDKEVRAGEKLIFKDMMHYTMVKTTTFNGIDHPSIGVWSKDKKFKLIRKFRYDEFKYRLS